MSKDKYTKPTESELEILQLLWSKTEATVRQVHDELLKTKEAGYTTTLKLMQIMFEKGLVHRDNSSKTHIYKAALQQDVVQKQVLNKMISTLFNGNSANLVLQVLGNHKSSNDELKEIEQYLKSKIS
jgi:BlaI family transcriptional regulator, penicillinase repressor